MFNYIFDDDDDDDEESIPLNKIISQILASFAITPVLPIMKPDDSLIMDRREGGRAVNDVYGASGCSSGGLDCCCEAVLLLVLRDKLITRPSRRGCPKENFKIYSNPLFEFDDEYISSDVNPLFNEVLEDIESEDSYVSKLDEPDLLVTPLSKLNEDECFDPGGDFVLEEIEACLTSDSIPPGIDDDDFDPEGDILLLEKLLNDDPSSPLPPKELNFEELKVIKSDVSTDFEDDYYDSEGDIIYLESLLIKDTITLISPPPPRGVFRS
ncbi:hypothetical protein Tco_0981321 [Tanacetum coccineum]